MASGIYIGNRHLLKLCKGIAANLFDNGKCHAVVENADEPLRRHGYGYNHSHTDEYFKNSFHVYVADADYIIDSFANEYGKIQRKCNRNG